MEIEKLINQIKTDGFCVLPNVISKSDCEEYKTLLEGYYSKYSSNYYTPNVKTEYGLEDKKNEKVVFNLHNKGLEWFKLFENERVTSILDVVLKNGSYKNSEPYNLLNISARSPLKNSGEQQLHLDSNLPGGEFPLICVVLWMLDDFTKENGATRLIPGSHKFLTYADNGKKYDEEIVVEGKAGSVLIYNASLWHGGNKNQTDGTRWGLVLGYGRWFIKPSFDFIKNTPHEIFNQLNDKQKQLLGFDTTPPKDEFTRMRRRSDTFETPDNYKLP